ncbi:hypothetical protein [Thiolapillus sp.]|uniref:hypothetical protein n=1 Tax=Thiolapillus sp. TaxID=2017437 RepID=UPI003AF6C7D7
MTDLTRVVIISGEGTGPGAIEPHTGAPTLRAIRARLTRERCGGDRWAHAIAYVADGEGVNVETDSPRYWSPAYDSALSKD